MAFLTSFLHPTSLYGFFWQAIRSMSTPSYIFRQERAPPTHHPNLLREPGSYLKGLAGTRVRVLVRMNEKRQFSECNLCTAAEYCIPNRNQVMSHYKPEGLPPQPKARHPKLETDQDFARTRARAQAFVAPGAALIMTGKLRKLVKNLRHI